MVDWGGEIPKWRDLFLLPTCPGPGPDQEPDLGPDQSKWVSIGTDNFTKRILKFFQWKKNNKNYKVKNIFLWDQTAHPSLVCSVQATLSSQQCNVRRKIDQVEHGEQNRSWPVHLGGEGTTVWWIAYKTTQFSFWTVVNQIEFLVTSAAKAKNQALGSSVCDPLICNAHGVKIMIFNFHPWNFNELTETLEIDEKLWVLFEKPYKNGHKQHEIKTETERKTAGKQIAWENYQKDA